jgi:hypothetical protein
LVKSPPLSVPVLVPVVRVPVDLWGILPLDSGAALLGGQLGLGKNLPDFVFGRCLAGLVGAASETLKKVSSLLLDLPIALALLVCLSLLVLVPLLDAGLRLVVSSSSSNSNGAG